jgi:excisionase family DNA binding protein
MHDHGTRLFRVQAIAEMFDVSVSTIYRAIENGQLEALRFGRGKGAVRVTASALDAFAAACAEAAHRRATNVGAAGSFDESVEG